MIAAFTDAGGFAAAGSGDGGSAARRGRGRRGRRGDGDGVRRARHPRSARHPQSAAAERDRKRDADHFRAHRGSRHLGGRGRSRRVRERRRVRRRRQRRQALRVVGAVARARRRPSGQRRVHIGHRLHALGGLLGETPEDQALQILGNRRLDRSRRRRRRADVEVNHLAEALGHERRPPAQHLEEDHAQRVDVGAVIDLARAAALLGRHVRGRPHHRCRCASRTERCWRPCCQQLGDAEVEHLHAARGASRRVVGHQEQVVGLEVAVDDAARVRGGQRARGLRGDAARVRRRQPARRARRRAARLSPSSSSMTMYGRRRRACRSRRSRRCRGGGSRGRARLVEEALGDSALSVKPGRRTLIAARRPMPGCSAR